MGIQVCARKEQHSEDSVDDVQEPGGRVSCYQEREPEESLEGGQAGHDQVARAEPTAHLRMAEVSIRAPDTERNREGDQRSRTHRVEEDERVGQLMGAQHLFAVGSDRQAQALLELYLRLPPELVERARVIEGDAVEVALTRRD